MTFAHDRRRGMLRALEGAGVADADQLFYAGNMTVENGHRFAKAALAEPEPPTAMICASILVALGALRAIAEAGLSVPDDVSLVVHDDEMPAFRADQMHPPLTTTRSSIRAAGPAWRRWRSPACRANRRRRCRRSGRSNWWCASRPRRRVDEGLPAVISPS